MFHRPLFYIVSLYTCVTLSDFLIHKKFIFQVDKSTSTNRKKKPQHFLTLQLQQVYENVRMLAMTSSTSSTVSVQLMILSRYTSASLMLH